MSKRALSRGAFSNETHKNARLSRAFCVLKWWFVQVKCVGASVLVGAESMADVGLDEV